jgi:hypothetical protein
LGWENWLTVDITRRLNNALVLPFFPYPDAHLGAKRKLDLYIRAPVRLAVELKVNYIDDTEIEKSGDQRPLPDRVAQDAEKISVLDQTIGKLLLVSTCFESRPGLDAYQDLVSDDFARRFEHFWFRWYNCSAGSGHNLLLALSSSAGLPRAA